MLVFVEAPLHAMNVASAVIPSLVPRMVGKSIVWNIYGKLMDSACDQSALPHVRAIRGNIIH